MILPLIIAMTQTVHLSASIDTSKVLNTFTPATAFGAGIDGQEDGDVERTFLPRNLELMKSAGLRSLTYRLRTELAIEAFHWNPEGNWSDEKNQCGYWTSSVNSDKPILKCYGYRLPRRGNTIDQANNDGYSRLDDGDESSFWKSNPYLDPAYTGETDKESPQWVLVDLGKPKLVNRLVIHWANPYAMLYRVEYWLGDNSQMGYDADGLWSLAYRAMQKTKPGDDTLSLTCRARVRYLRILLWKSSHTACPTRHLDPRDSLGFAIREIELGCSKDGRFTDFVKHRPDNRQTVFYVSSTDPWHEATDRDRLVEQPGFDLVKSSGLGCDLPILLPVPALYDTPENAAAEVNFLESRHIKIRGIEIGEEPDGQCINPEQYAALYLQVARAIRAIDQTVQLGGPSFQSVELDYLAWPEGRADRMWIRRFYDYLASHHADKLLQFLSFEWYPFDDVSKDPEPQLMHHRAMLSEAMVRLRAAGLPKSLPLLMTEYGYSAFAGPQEDDLPAALLNAETVGRFLELGGSAAFLYGYEPNVPTSDANDNWGNLMMFETDSSGTTKYLLPTYYGAQAVTQHWCGDANKPHQLLRVSLEGKGKPLMSAFAVRRTDGQIALMVLNKSRTESIRLRVNKDGRGWNTMAAFEYSPKQYRWLSDEERGHPVYSLPPEELNLGEEAVLPPFSITVLTETQTLAKALK
jgi:hypothetical protein